MYCSSKLFSIICLAYDNCIIQKRQLILHEYFALVRNVITSFDVLFWIEQKSTEDGLEM
jgi:hypothetical protein